MGYVVRQNADRKMPSSDQEWLVEYLPTLDGIEFRRFQEEDYSGVVQIPQAALCDVLIGVHGNGSLTSYGCHPKST